MDDSKFAKDVRIHFRVTNYRRMKIRNRARELGKPVSQYILDLIDLDLEGNKKEETN